MENPGCIVYADHTYIHKSAVSKDCKAENAATISHEIAHMWFGNLVTMKWWNDLWLNESFADYISYWCLSKYQNKLEHSTPTDAWIWFNTNKGRGYTEDQLKSTHPIVLNVLNTDHAISIFDGITYSKGASVLRQLMALIGEENFGKAT